jgi:hypothetical protein
MKTTLAFLLSTAAALFAVNTASAAPAAPSATSYAELLEPVPNASQTLIADDLARAQQKPLVQLVQFRHHHHHHHHHHHGFGGFGIFLGGAPGYAYGGDCYWRWTRPYWNGWRWVRHRVRVCD